MTPAERWAYYSRAKYAEERAREIVIAREFMRRLLPRSAGVALWLIGLALLAMVFDR